MNKFKKIKFNLQARLTILVVVVVLVSMSLTAYLIGSKAIEKSRDFQAEKVMDIAAAISHTKIVIDGLTGKEPTESIQVITKHLLEEKNVQYSQFVIEIIVK